MKPGPTSAIASVLSSYKKLSLEKKLNRELTKEEEKKFFTKEITQKVNEIERQLKEEQLTESLRGCPECLRSFSVLKIDKSEIDYCDYCKSFWIDLKELMALTTLSQPKLQEGIKNKDIPSKYKCPVCNKTLAVYEAAMGSNSKIEVCIEHGFYMESKEVKTKFG